MTKKELIEHWERASGSETVTLPAKMLMDICETAINALDLMEKMAILIEEDIAVQHTAFISNVNTENGVINFKSGPPIIFSPASKLLNEWQKFKDEK